MKFLKNLKQLSVAILAIICLLTAACSETTKKVPMNEEVTVAIYQTKLDNGNYIADGVPLLEEQVHLSEAVVYPEDDGMVTIPFNFQNVGGYAEITEHNIGKRIAISLNGTVVYTPLVKMRLENGASSVVVAQEQVKEIFPKIDL